MQKIMKKSIRGLEIHQRRCKNNLLDDKTKFPDESNTIVTRATENDITKRHLKSVKTL